MTARSAPKFVLRIGLSLAFSALFLWLAFRNVNWADVMEQFRHIELGYVAIYAVVLVLIQGCRIFRWNILIRPFAPVSTGQLMRIANLGMMLILVLPLRLGELARPYLLKKETGASMSAGLGTVTVERAVDGLLVTLLFFLTTTQLEAPYEVPPAVRAAAWISLAIFMSAMGALVAALATGDLIPRIIRKLGTPISPGLTEKAVGILEAFVSGLRALPDTRALALYIGYTLAYWGLNGAGLYAVMLAFGWQVLPVAGFVVVSIIVLGIMIPAGPGNLGTFQAAILIGLAIFKVDASEAAAYGLVVYPMTLFVLVAFGLPYVFLGTKGDIREVMGASGG